MRSSLAQSGTTVTCRNGETRVFIVTSVVHWTYTGDCQSSPKFDRFPGYHTHLHFSLQCTHVQLRLALLISPFLLLHSPIVLRAHSSRVCHWKGGHQRHIILPTRGWAISCPNQSSVPPCIFSFHSFLILLSLPLHTIRVALLLIIQKHNHSMSCGISITKFNIAPSNATERAHLRGWAHQSRQDPAQPQIPGYHAPFRFTDIIW